MFSGVHGWEPVGLGKAAARHHRACALERERRSSTFAFMFVPAYSFIMRKKNESDSYHVSENLL